MEKFTYQGSRVSSTETNINTRLAKAWTAIDRLSVIGKSDLTDKMKRSFFQAAVVSILLYGCTTWMLTKRMEKKLDGNDTRMRRAILNKSWRQHSTKQQLYGHLQYLDSIFLNALYFIWRSTHILHLLIHRKRVQKLIWIWLACYITNLRVYFKI